MTCVRCIAKRANEKRDRITIIEELCGDIIEINHA